MRRPGLALLCSLMLFASYSFLATPAAGEARNPARADDGWLGIMLGNAQAADDAPGVPIAAIIEDGPAEKAELRAQDVIVAVDGTAVLSREELLRHVRSIAPGSWVSITVRRKGENLDRRARLGSRPLDTSGLRPRRGWIGIEVIDLPPGLRQHFGAPADAGVMVAHVDPASPGEAAGFELGDVLFEIDGKRLTSAEDFKARLASSGVGNEAEFAVARSGVEVVLETVIDAAPSGREQSGAREPVK